MAGAKNGEWFAGMSWETVPFSTAFRYMSAGTEPTVQYV